MNPTVIQNCLEALSAQIALCQDAIKALHGVNDRLNGVVAPGPMTPAPARTVRRMRKGRMIKAKSPPHHSARNDSANPGASAFPAAKPDTLGGAMKLLCARLGQFTQESLRQALDAEFSDLLEKQGDQNFYGNLSYWTKTEKLTKSGGAGADATYEVKDAEWFAPKD